MKDTSELPLLNHPLEETPAFTPDALLEAVRNEKNLPRDPIPRVCLLDFDGDATDWLVASGRATRCASWACFHTPMWSIEIDGEACGIVPRTIGGPYAVLAAEQLAASGAKLILGLTSAGRVDPSLPLPSFVVATGAVRDEGTSYHYIAPGAFIAAPTGVIGPLRAGLETLGRRVSQGAVWTTDAPYRETRSQLAMHASAKILAVEMQAASLFAFAEARGAAVGVVAQVTNAVDQTEEAFDKGTPIEEGRVVEAILRAGLRYLDCAAASGLS